MRIFQNLYNRKNLARLCLAVLLLSLVPLLYVSRYNHPTGDDIYYGLDAHMVWEDTHSLPQTMRSALLGAAHDYQAWQGTYTAMLLMRLQPSVFSERLYFLTPFLVIGLLLGGYGYLLRQLGRYVVPMGQYELLGIWSVLMILSLQWVISPAEAFYWYNGSVYYSGFYGLTMLLFGLVCKYACTARKTTLAGIFLLELLIGGGNYLTLLWSILALLLASAWQWLKRRPGRMGLTCAALFQLACFAVSAAAPGNAVRQASVTSMPAWRAILASLRQGTFYLSIWLNGWWITGAMLLLVFMLPAIRRMSFRFPCPFLAVGLMYGLFCTLSCPTFYAQSNAGPARALNVVYYGFILTSYIALFYLAGWVYNKRKVKEETAPLSSVSGGLLLLVLTLQICIGANDDTLKLASSVQALRDLVHGTAAAYGQEYQERIRLLETDDAPDVVLLPYQHRPLTVYVGDYGADPAQVSNQALARWYGHRSVIVDYDSSGY